MCIRDSLPPDVRDRRTATLAARTAALGADALVLSFLPDIRWATGFSGSNALVLADADGLTLYTDGRYGEQARRECPGVRVEVPGYDLVGALAGLAGRRAALQADHVTVALYADLAARHPDTAWVEASAILERDVAVKTDAEIARIDAAQRITEAVFDDVCDVVSQALRSGEVLTERAVGAHIVYGHLSRGCDRMAFDPIVASGANGALPHLSLIHI